MKALRTLLSATAMTVSLTSVCIASPAKVNGNIDTRPNIVVIIVDDMGFSDLGAFGSEIRTPNLDKLANAGVKLNNFHTTPVCAPTRAELMTGIDHHQTGIGHFPEFRQDNQIGKPGYEGYLNGNVATIAERLQDAGYLTVQAGKWHLGMDPSANPARRGFERSFALVNGGHNHFGNEGQIVTTKFLPNATNTYTLNGVRIDPPSRFYSSTYFTNQFLKLLPDKKEKRPFFAYLAFTAPHYPLQAPKEDVARYAGKYDVGYDEIRKRRLDNLVKLGLISRDTIAHTQTSPTRWESLSSEEKKLSARTMEVYAAMVDNIDQNVGRVIEALKKSGKYDNTVFVFLSDNGPEGTELEKSFLFSDLGKAMLKSGDNRLESIGSENSYIWYGTNWAEASSAPFSRFKSFPSEGGTRVAAFLSYSKHGRTGVEPSYISVRDIAPTLFEFAKATPQDPTILRGKKVIPYQGTSFMSRVLPAPPSPKISPDFDAGEIFGRRFVREGRWKALHIPQPYGSGKWELYDMEKDPGETRNLADVHSDITERLVKAWNQYAVEKGVVLPVVPGN